LSDLNMNSIDSILSNEWCAITNGFNPTISSGDIIFFIGCG